jgi:hypothetical protein
MGAANFSAPVGVAAFHQLHRQKNVEAFSCNSTSSDNFLSGFRSDHKPFFRHVFQPHKIRFIQHPLWRELPCTIRHTSAFSLDLHGTQKRSCSPQPLESLAAYEVKPMLPCLSCAAHPPHTGGRSSSRWRSIFRICWRGSAAALWRITQAGYTSTRISDPSTFAAMVRHLSFRSSVPRFRIAAGCCKNRTASDRCWTNQKLVVGTACVQCQSFSSNP